MLGGFPPVAQDFKRVVVVAPEFVPQNLAGVMRTRFLAAHLAEFGWTPHGAANARHDVCAFTGSEA